MLQKTYFLHFLCTIILVLLGMFEWHMLSPSEYTIYSCGIKSFEKVGAVNSQGKFVTQVCSFSDLFTSNFWNMCRRLCVDSGSWHFVFVTECHDIYSGMAEPGGKGGCTPHTPRFLQISYPYLNPGTGGGRLCQPFDHLPPQIFSPSAIPVEKYSIVVMTS